MSAIQAKNNYTGQNGCKRMNCAQSVLSAFKEDFNIGEDMLEAFKSYGGGKAPNGLCGAFYAVKYIINKQQNHEKVAELEEYFLKHAGALECSNIRGLRKLSCVGCVEKSSEFLEGINMKRMMVIQADSIYALKYTSIKPEEAKKRLENEEGIILLDVRTQEEYLEKHIPKSMLIPVDVIEKEAPIKLTDKNAPIFVYCRSGRRSAIASEALVQMGYTKVYDLGGINDWTYETESGNQ